MGYTSIRHVGGLLFELFRSVRNRGEPDRVGVSLSVCGLFISLSGSVRISAGGGTDCRRSIRSTGGCVFSRVNRRLGIGSVTSCVRVDPSRFSEIFGRRANFSPCRFILMAELGGTGSFLGGGSLAISRVTCRMNFGDSTGFICFFAGRANCSPGGFEGLMFWKNCL